MMDDFLKTVDEIDSLFEKAQHAKDDKEKREYLRKIIDLVDEREIKWK